MSPLARPFGVKAHERLGYSHLVDNSPPSADSMRFRYATNVRILSKFVIFTLICFFVNIIHFTPKRVTIAGNTKL